MTKTNLLDSPDMEMIPETIILDKLKPGRPTTEESRRKRMVKGLTQPGKVTGNRNYYSDKIKMDVVCSYAITGNSRRVAEMHGISEGTIRSWKTTAWWNEIMSRIQQEQDDETVSKLTQLIDKAVDGVNDRLDNGDWIYDIKRGKLVRKPVSAKELTIVTAISVDKRELLKGKPTQRIEKVSTDERFTELKKKFLEFSQAAEITMELENEVWAQSSQETPDTDEDFGDSEVEEEDEEIDEGLTINEMFGEE